MSKDNEIVCAVAGHPDSILRIGFSRHMCGHIADGMSLANGEKAGGYVVSFADFEKAYFAAKKFREKFPPSEDDKKMASLITQRRAR